MMKLAVAQLMKCDGILMLEGWQASKGANIELWLAKMFGLSIYDINLMPIEIGWEEISLPDWQAVQKHLNI